MGFGGFYALVGFVLLRARCWGRVDVGVIESHVQYKAGETFSAYAFPGHNDQDGWML